MMKMRRAMRKPVARFMAGLMASAMVLSGLGNPMRTKAAVNSTENDTFESTINNNSQTKKIELGDNVVLAETEKYKDMDYSFLKDFDFGSTYDGEITVEFNCVEDMVKSTLSNIKTGKIVKTHGYYSYGDGGSMCYSIAKDKGSGAIELSNGLYANPICDSYTDKAGNKWNVVSVLQMGAVANDEKEDHLQINKAIELGGKSVQTKDADGGSADPKVLATRSIVYIPRGEFKLGNQMNIGYSNLNIVGEGDDTVVYTDNDYRDEEGYSEHLVQIWGAQSCYIADFVVEAREVDLYHYMRQVSCIYSKDVYLYNVDMIVPQGAYSAYYYQDKQYSNFCCYTGNTRITADGCKMVQMSGTFRGANVGVLDIWAAGEQDITVMNCDLYGNARDEQIGFFSRDSQSAFVHNVEFVNNTIHAYQPRNIDVVGNATMRFTVAYSDSHDVDGIHIAGNHFIVECDSKFMTFGAVKNCVIENNIIEVYCTYATWSMVFDSSNGDADNILVQNNEFFISSNENIGKGNIVGGKLTLKNNRIVTDVVIPFGVLSPKSTGNEIICMEPIGYLTNNGDFTNNKVTLYDGMCASGLNFGYYALYDGDNVNSKFTGNTITDYSRPASNRYGSHHALFRLWGNIDSLEVKNNTFIAPNYKFTSSDLSDTKVEVNGEKYYVRRIFSRRGGVYQQITVSDNKFQSAVVLEPEKYADTTYTNNTFTEPTIDLSDVPINKMYMTYNGQKVTELATSNSSIQLDNIQLVANEYDEETGAVTGYKQIANKDVDWVCSVNGIATVSTKGLVKRKMYGDVHIYAVAKDGSGCYAECVVSFQKESAKSITIDKETITLQPGLKTYVDYTVLPAAASQEVTWESKNEAVAKVNYKGLVTAVATGETDIICKTTDGTNISNKVHVVVSDVTAKKINMKKAFNVYTNDKIGTKDTIYVASYSPSNCSNQYVGKWVSTNESVATVDENGVITIKGGGVTGIRAYSSDEQCYGETNVYVYPSKVENVKVEAVTDTSVKLTWDKADDNYGYYIYKYNSDTAEWEAQGNSYVTSDSYTVKNLTPGTSYRFKVCSFLSNWQTGSRIIYESEETVVDVDTLSFTPVTKINVGQNTTQITLGLGNEPIFYIRDNLVANVSVSFTADTNADNRELEFVYDESMIEAVDIVRGSNEYGTVSDEYTYRLYLKGIKTGITYITARAKDGSGFEKTIPVGISNGQKVSNIEYSVNYHQVSFSFDGVEDESGIQGYYIAKIVGYRWYYLDFIEKNSTKKYSYVYWDDVLEKSSVRLAVCTYFTDGTHGFYGSTAYLNPKSSENYAIVLPEIVKTENVSLDSKVYQLKVGQSKVINSIIDASATYHMTDWFVSNTDIAAVNVKACDKNESQCQATLTGVKPGATKVTALTTDSTDLSASAVVVVVPDKVKAFTMTAKAYNAVSLKWSKAEGADGYYLYRYDYSTKNWKIIKNITDGNTVTYKDTAVKAYTSYKYRVAPYIQNEGSSYRGDLSDIITVKTKPVPVKATVTGYSGTYDKKAHNSVSFKGANTKYDKITYSVDNKKWTSKRPTVTNASDTKYIYVRLVREGYNKVYTYKVKAVVKKASVPVNKIKLNKKSFVYNANVQKPTVSIAGLKKGVDYTVTYSVTASKNPGTYRVTIKGKGNYTGSKTYSYTIKMPTVTMKGVSCVSGRKMNVYWNKLSNVSGYQIVYSASSIFKTGNKYVYVAGATKTSKAITNLVKGKRYYVKVRAYRTINNKKIFGSWSAKKSILISR